jgi:hypothetical protein
LRGFHKEKTLGGDGFEKSAEIPPYNQKKEPASGSLLHLWIFATSATQKSRLSGLLSEFARTKGPG